MMQYLTINKNIKKVMENHLNLKDSNFKSQLKFKFKFQPLQI